MDYNLTVFVNTCDLYSDGWYPFFRFLDINGGELKQYPIVLAAEKKDFSYDGLNLTVLKYRKNRPWGERIIKQLSQIDSKFVFFVIDDYYLLKPFESSAFHIALNYLNNHPEVGYMNLLNRQEDITSEPVFRELDPNKNRLHLHTSIWKRDYFIKLLRKHESIWDFERYSCIRARNYPEKCVYFSSNTICYYYQHPSTVNNGKSISGDGYGIVRTKWLRSNIELFKKYDINVDFSNLGFFSSESDNESTNQKERMTLIEEVALKNGLFKKIDNRIKKYQKKYNRSKEKKHIKKSFK